MGNIHKVIALAVIFLFIFDNVMGTGCRRRTPNGQHSTRKHGDNGYKLIIGDRPTGYFPGKTYNLLLLGARTFGNVQKFSSFMLTAEAETGATPGRRSTTLASSPKRVGRFQLYSDSLVKFNDNCVNTVSEANDLPKTEIQVMWVAPETGSGCVALSAMVFESPSSWYADDGLTQVICEQKTSDAGRVKKECCACDEAKYNFIFEGIWSNETHPKDYPFAIWLTHFSDIVGATHDTNFSFWGENHIATDGFRSLAEWGSPSALEVELRAKGPRLRTLIKAAGLWYPDVNTNTSSNFRVDRKHHKVSLASMFGPSPDWVVGINGLDLCNEDCSWKDNVNIDLFPWDAGTDNGITYMSPNSETQPREKMYAITTMYPEDPRAPFYNSNSDTMTPLAKLYIRREKLIPKTCDDDFLQALQNVEVSENSEEEYIRRECKVTAFSTWSACSVTCGKGIRMKTRQYINARLSKQSDCSRQLISKEMCVASIPECSAEPIDDDEGENLAKSDSLVGDNGEGVGICTTTQWADWSECSATCGIGITMRTRTFVNHIGRKKCPHVSIVEKQKCMRPDCTFEQEELPDPLCPVTTWSDWSPCSASCGKGVSIRTRLVLVEPQLLQQCSERKELHQQRECSVSQSCIIDINSARDICVLSPDVGPCRSGRYDRFAYNPHARRCEKFIYGGCRGNRNNFLTHDDCMQNCQILAQEYFQRHDESTSSQSRNQQYNQQTYDNEPIDCQLSEWTNWSSCNVSCGIGISERYRTILRQSRNGGLPCPRKLDKKRRCHAPAC